MQFYVLCKQPGDGSNKVYVRFEKEPQTRAEIPFWSFQMTCSLGHTHTYYRADVHAEIGLEPLGGAILGGLLFFVDPFLGAAGAIGGYAAVNKAEKDKVTKFEASVG